MQDRNPGFWLFLLDVGSWITSSCIALGLFVYRAVPYLRSGSLQSSRNAVHVVPTCSPLDMLGTPAQLAPNWNVTVATEPRSELVEVSRRDGGFAFSRDTFRGEIGSVIRFELPGDEVITILESSMPPCSQDADVVHHTLSEGRDVDGKRYVEVETSRGATTYLFILSESQPECSPACCFTFVPNPKLSTGVPRPGGPFPTATAGMNLPLVMLPGTAMTGTVMSGTAVSGTVMSGTVRSASHTPLSAGSLATGTLYGVPSTGTGTILPPIENRASVAMHTHWLTETISMVVFLGGLFWFAK